MGSDKKSFAVSDEYQYADENTGEESLLETPQKRTPTFQSIKEKLLERLPKKKKYRALLFLALGVYVIYKFLDVGTPPPKSTTPTPTKIVAQPLTKPADEKTQVVAPTKKVEKTVTTPVIATPAKNIEFNTSDAHAGTSVNVPSAMSSAQIKELQTSLDQMNHSVMALESSLLGLTNSVIRLSNKVNVLETFQKSLTVATIQNPGFFSYYVQSLTAGRAWLKSSTGNTTTVREGDFLPSYGQIQKIDVRAGAVFTSSGRVIHYGPNDN